MARSILGFTINPLTAQNISDLNAGDPLQLFFDGCNWYLDTGATGTVITANEGVTINPANNVQLEIDNLTPTYTTLDPDDWFAVSKSGVDGKIRARDVVDFDGTRYLTFSNSFPSGTIVSITAGGPGYTVSGDNVTIGATGAEYQSKAIFEVNVAGVSFDKINEAVWQSPTSIQINQVINAGTIIEVTGILV